MQVQTTHAPVRADHEDQSVYFCSDHCAARFAADPARYFKIGDPPMDD